MSRPRDEERLLARARSGEEAAVEELVREHEVMAFKVAFAILGDRGEAEEATQDGLVKALRALPRFRAGAPFRPWLLRIVGNEARNRARSRRRRVALTLRAAAEPSGGAAPSPEAVVTTRERNERLLAAVDHLRDEDRLTVTYRYLLGLSEAECAAALGVRRGTVKSRSSRALARIRALLDEEVRA